MKILIIKSKGHPVRLLKDEYIEKINQVDESIDVVATFDEKEIAKHIIDADAIACSPRDFPSIDGAKNLKWVHSFSAGVDRILTPEVKNSDIVLSNSSGIHATPIAEHIIGFMLVFTRGFFGTFRNQQKKLWQKNEELTELRDKAVLILGLGRIGTEAARLANCFGAHVFAVDSVNKDKPEFVEELKTPEHLGEMLGRADFVALCLPYTKENHHFFDGAKMEKMKSSAVLINIGRGGVVHEHELIEALNNKVIAGAGLDVTEEEPLPEASPLWGMENVVITPHHSGLSERYMDRAIDRFCLNLRAFLAGERLPNLVDKELGY